jgi:hypothetical protein
MVRLKNIAICGTKKLKLYWLMQLCQSISLELVFLTKIKYLEPYKLKTSSNSFKSLLKRVLKKPLNNRCEIRYQITCVRIFFNEL